MPALLVFSVKRKSWTFSYVECMPRLFYLPDGELVSCYTLYHSLDRQLASHILTQYLDETWITECYFCPFNTK